MSASRSHISRADSPRNGAPMPAGGVATPPADPPSASPTPLQGQVETNQSPDDESAAENGPTESDDRSVTAFEFGWQNSLQFGRAPAGSGFSPIVFENAEPELRRLWDTRQSGRKEQQPWEAARETARDAWNQVQNAFADGSVPKPSAR
jgi:hypothetical protein